MKIVLRVCCVLCVDMGAVRGVLSPTPANTDTAVDNVDDRTVVGDEPWDARAVVTGTVFSEHIVNIAITVKSEQGKPFDRTP